MVIPHHFLVIVNQIICITDVVVVVVITVTIVASDSSDKDLQIHYLGSYASFTNNMHATNVQITIFNFNK